MAEQKRLFRLLLGMTIVAAAMVLCAFGQNSPPLKSAVLPPALTQGERELADGRTTLDVRTLTAARNRFQQCVQQQPKNANRLYHLALTDSYLRQAAEYAKDDAAAKRWLNTAISDVQSAITLDDHSSDAHALLADLYGSKITGMLSGMHYGPRANAEVQRAFQLDPKNPLAFAVVGRKYFYAPTMFGGGIDKAVASFLKATELDPDDYENFVWLSLAYRKKGDTAKAQQALAEALRLSPHSAFALRVQSGKGQ